MDIDEFLDREIQAMSTEPAKKESILSEKPKPEKVEAAKEANDFSKLEAKYLNLWGNISKERFTWNSSLYSELSNLSSEANSLMENAALKLRKDKNAIKALIEEANIELNHNNNANALNIYSQVIEIRDNVPDVFFEEKKELNAMIFRLYEKLHMNIESKTATEFKMQASKINELVRKSFSYMDQNRIEDAKNCYEEALNTFRYLPRGFLPIKVELGNNLLSLYKELNIHLLINNLHEQLAHGRLREATNRKIMDFEQTKRMNTHEYHPGKKSGSADQRKSLLNRLVAWKLERAEFNLKKGLYADARKNVESVLRLDPRNKDAKRMIKKIPA